MSFTGELTLKDRATMAMRATYLITIFLPFIFLGPLLLFLADLLLKWSQDSKVQINGHRYLLFHQRVLLTPVSGAYSLSMLWQEMHWADPASPGTAMPQCGVACMDTTA